jgi:hypothetical protein
MISVVVPTMWKFVPFLNFLQDMVACDLISQIIVINNDNQATPEHKILAHAKITLLDYGQNLYVNPSWNLGVYHCKNDIICIANDDLLFDLRVLSKIIKEFLPTHGSVGIQSLGNNTGIMDFFPALGHDLFGFGQLMFVYKSNWVDIPCELTIAYGDNFIFDIHRKFHMPNYLIGNMLQWTPGSVTSSQIPSINGNESFQYLDICKKYHMEIFYPCPIFDS